MLAEWFDWDTISFLCGLVLGLIVGILIGDTDA